MRTLNLFECAEFLNIERTYALKLAGAGKLPGAKIGRAWVFLEDDLVEFLRAQVRDQMLQRQTEANEVDKSREHQVTIGRPRTRPAIPKTFDQ